MKRLQNKIAVVTGGTSGIGLATAKRFAQEGARVFITGRRQPELDKAVEAIGNGAVSVQADASKLADLDRLYDTVKRRADHIDIVFANAGVGSMAPLGEITEESYTRMFDTNVKGTLFTVQKALPLMREGGAIVVMSSTAGVKGAASTSVYSATKAAIRNFARSWSLDLAPRKIRVNAISPGVTDTPGLKLLAGDGSYEQFKQALVGMTSLGRVGEPDEIAKAVVFLASDDSSYMTGAELFADGGLAQV